jgi:hypothetical protein
MDGHGRMMDAMYLGTLAFGDPIVRLSREFVNNLNKLNE